MNTEIDAGHLRRLLWSYTRWTGRALLPPQVDEADQLRFLHHWNHVVLSHDTGHDPRFNYGNLAALSLFEMAHGDFHGLPSRLSAVAPDRTEREKLLAEVRRKGFADDYRGVRISAKGQRFRIERATVWNIIDEEGTFHGQAATFREWTYLDQGMDGWGI